MGESELYSMLIQKGPIMHEFKLKKETCYVTYEQKSSAERAKKALHRFNNKQSNLQENEI